MTAIAPANTSHELVNLDELRPHPANRKRFDQAELEELARSLTTVGQLTPAIVRPIDDPHSKHSYELLAGERRWRAAKIAGLPQLMVIVRELTDDQALEVLAIENNQREDPDALDEAELFKAMLTLKGYNVAKIAERLKRSETYIRERLRLLRLIDAAKKLVIDGTIPVQHAALLATLSPADQKRALGEPERGGGYVDGLFRMSRTIFDEGYTYALVTLPEFRDWVRTEVRLDPRAEIVGELFPETAAAVQEADTTRQKVLSLTTDYRVRDAAKDPKVRTIGHEHWKRADGKKGHKTCQYAELGVVVAGEARGEAFRVCIRKDKCGIHWAKEAKAAEARAKAKAREGTGASGSAPEKPAGKTAEQEAKEAAIAAELVRWSKAAEPLLQALVAALRKQPASADSKLGKRVLERCWNDKALRKYFTPVTAADVVQFVVLSELYDEDVPSTIDTEHDIAAFRKVLKEYGVDAKAIVDKVSPPAKPAKQAKPLNGAQEIVAGLRKAAAKRAKKKAGER